MIYFYLLLIAFISPVLSLIAGGVFAWTRKEYDIKALLLYCFLFSVLLGALNTTKEMDSDIEQYYLMFVDAGNSGLFSYLSFYGQEPFYYFISWLSFHVFGGDWKLFIFAITVVEYMLLGCSVILFSGYSHLRNREAVLALSVLFLYFQLFSISSQLIRQMLATSMLIYFLTNFYLRGRNKWWLAVLSVLTHTTVIPVLVISILPMNRTKFKISSFILLIAALGGLSLCFLKIIPFLANRITLPFFSLISYFDSRLGDSSTLMDDFGRVDRFNIPTLIFLLLYFLGLLWIIIRQNMSIMLVRRFNGDKSNFLLQFSKVPEEVKERNSSFVIYISLLLILFVMSCNMFEGYYLAQRFVFYLYAFIGIVLVMFMTKSRFFGITAVNIAITAGMVGYFFFYLSSGVFSYESISDVLKTPLFVYFI